MYQKKQQKTKNKKTNKRIKFTRIKKTFGNYEIKSMFIFICKTVQKLPKA